MVATVLSFSDPPGDAVERRVRVKLDSGEICAIALGRSGVVVRKALIGLWGTPLYRQRDGLKVTVMALILQELYPERLLPIGFNNFNLSAFTNAVLYHHSCLQIATLFRQVTHRAPETWPPPPWWTPSWPPSV
jgi:hypothetical protein